MRNFASPRFTRPRSRSTAWWARSGVAATRTLADAGPGVASTPGPSGTAGQLAAAPRPPPGRCGGGAARRTGGGPDTTLTPGDDDRNRRLSQTPDLDESTDRGGHRQSEHDPEHRHQEHGGEEDDPQQDHQVG